MTQASGRGTRRELWAPPDSGSAHRRIAGLYRVPTLDPSRSPRRPRISFPSPLPQPSHLPAGHGEKFRRTRAHVQLGTSLFTKDYPECQCKIGRAGDLGGALEENCGPHLTAVLLNQRIVRCIVYRRSTLAVHSFPSLRRFLTLAPACWPRGKIPPHPSARSARNQFIRQRLSSVSV